MIDLDVMVDDVEINYADVRAWGDGNDVTVEVSELGPESTAVQEIGEGSGRRQKRSSVPEN